MRIKFSINKETCFAYWVQSLIEWGGVISKADAEYYRAQGGSFSVEESEALERLKPVLQKEDNYYLWLWGRYVGDKIRDEREKQIWESVVSTLSPRFNELWAAEFPLLEGWKKELEASDLSAMQGVFEFSEKFFGVGDSKNQEVDVRLCLGNFPEAPEGHAKREFPEFVLANISHTLHAQLPRVLGVIAHEILHKIEYQSPISTNLLKNSYDEIIKPAGITTEWKWKDLMTEAVITSVASKRFNNFFGRMIVKDEKMIKSDVVAKMNFEKYGKISGSLIRVVAGRLESLTAKYLNEGRVIDQEYCDEVARQWVKLFTEK